MSVVQAAPAPAEKGRDWSRFPVNRLLADRRMQRVFPKLLWLVVPCAYYYLTITSASFSSAGLIPAAALVVLLVTSMVIGAGVVAALLRPFGNDGYFGLARSWVVTVLGTWAMALALECLSYYATGRMDPENPVNVVSVQLCSLSNQFCFSRLAGALAHAICALIGAALLAAIIRLTTHAVPATGGMPALERVAEPRIWLAGIAVGVLMQFLDGLII